jgi:hypothetical protein
MRQVRLFNDRNVGKENPPIDRGGSGNSPYGRSLIPRAWKQSKRAIMADLNLAGLMDIWQLKAAFTFGVAEQRVTVLVNDHRVAGEDIVNTVVRFASFVEDLARTC